MNKKLLSVAIGAALAVSAGVASADVSWYGKANVNVIGGDTNGGTDDTILLDSSGSRIGINASEDLGNGITMKYWHEWRLETTEGAGFSAAPNSGQWGHRDNLLSINGDFGSFGGGDIAAPSKVIGAGKLDMFADTVGDMNGGGLISQPAGAQLRYGNKVGDVSFTLAYAPEDGTADRSWSDGNVMYSSGAIAAGLGFHQSGDLTHPSFAGGQLINMFVSYTMDNMMFLAGYESVSDVTATGGNQVTDTGVDATMFTVGASFGFDSNTVKAQYTAKDQDGDTGATRIAVGFEHSLAKSTAVGVHYTTLDPQASGADSPSLYDVGMSFSF